MDKEATKAKILHQIAFHTIFIWFFAFITGAAFLYAFESFYMVIAIIAVFIFQILFYKNLFRFSIQQLLEEL